MPRNSEFNSYTFILNDLVSLGWNKKNPTRDHKGHIYTQQECLDHPEIGKFLGRKKPEFVIKVRENSYWVLEAKGETRQIDQAFNEALDYAKIINKSDLIKAKIICGVAGNDIDGYLIKVAFLHSDNTFEEVTYNDQFITGLLSPDQAKHLVDNNTHKLNELIADEAILLGVAEKVNEELHEASINKDKRASVMSSILLSMVSDTLPNFDASPHILIREINNRAEDILISHSKREFASQIELNLPKELAAQEKFKNALLKVFFLLRKINVKAAMNGGQDLLGKFYEVFLKYGNGAKDIGIVLTPRHITRFACKVIGINEDDIIYDPACGTGGFLVAAYDEVRNANPSNLDHFKKHQIYGVEQQANVATLAIVNMIFRGDGKNNIINNDCFAVNLHRNIRNGGLSAEYIPDISERPPVTKALMNPPFALKKGDEKEYKFIEHALNQMANGGLLFAVLPSSVMYSTGANLAWRKELLKRNTLLSVASFSNELFYPQATVEPITIIIKKGVKHEEGSKIAWLRITNDGFSKKKKKRLPNGDDSMLVDSEKKLADYILNGNISQEVGVVEFKEIKKQDTKLELVPANYMSSPKISQNDLTIEMKNTYREVVFQTMKNNLK